MMTDIEVESDVCYARVGDVELCLDIYRPISDQTTPVVLYMHGGGWARGDKRDHAEARLKSMARLGIAVASANYRLVPENIFPSQIHDAKAAIRWLRANGQSRGLATEKIAAWGASAGGYLATMVGLTAGDKHLEGTVGDYLEQSSAVQAVVTWFSHYDFLSISRQSPLETRLRGIPLAAGLFGVDEVAIDNEVINRASPSRRIHRAAPPFLIAHGDSDHIVWASESAQLHAGLSRDGVDATFCLLAAAGHEDPMFDGRTNMAMTAAWLREKLSS
jgi:acetyl esterase/lipase